MDFILDPQHARIAYNSFLLAGLILFYWHGWYYGRRAGLDQVRWLTSLALLMLALLAGMHLGGLDAAGWRLLGQGDLSGLSRQGGSLMGGILLFLVVGGFVVWRFRWPAGTMDYLLLAAPLAAAVGRLGCLSAGCCEGVLCADGWGWRYGAESGLFYRQWEAGLIGLEHSTTLPVHPVPAYLIVGNLLVFLLSWRYSRRAHKPGQVAALTFTLFFVMQLCVGFFRASAGNHLFGTVWSGMMLSQWLQLILAAAAGGLFYWLGRRKIAAADVRLLYSERLPLFWLAALAVGSVCWFPWLGVVERSVLLLAWLPLLLAAAQRLLGQAAYARWQLTMATLPVAVIFGVTMATDTIPSTQHALANRKWVEIGGMRFSANYPQRLARMECIAYDCFSCEQYESLRDKANYRHVLYTGDITYNIDNGKSRHSFGLKGAFGRIDQEAGEMGHILAEKGTMIGTGFSYGYSSLYWAVHTGMLYGSYRYPDRVIMEDGHGISDPFYQIDLSVRAGLLHRFFGEINIMSYKPHFIEYNPNKEWFYRTEHSIYALSVGYGFNDRTRDTRLSFGLVGLQTSHHLAGVGGSLQLPLFRHRVLARVDLANPGGHIFLQAGLKTRLFLD